MKRFNNILFVSHGVTDETEALKQALSLARNNKAELKVLIVRPELPKEMKDYKDKFEKSLVEQMRTSIQAARAAIKSGDTDVSVDIQVDNSDPFVIRYGKTAIQVEVESGQTPAVRIIRQVLKNCHDLVIKEAEPKEGGKGFKAVDMELLRKCPCPIFLSRPISRHRDQIKVAVAVDPESLTPEGHDLSLRLLEIARGYADTCDGELNIISCWDYEFEESLRHNPWITMKKEEVDNIVRESCHQSFTALESLVEQAKISGKIRVHHLRGDADKTIPKHVEEMGVDVLIMGTVARTGIPGFIIGNTAENIVQKLSCSLLAMKPNGFISPIKAY
jgi:universal stress protein E